MGLKMSSKFPRKALEVKKKSTNLYAKHGEIARYPMKTYREMVIIKYVVLVKNSEVKKRNTFIINMYKMLMGDSKMVLTGIIM